MNHHGDILEDLMKIAAVGNEWQAILSRFPKELQREIALERGGTSEDIKELQNWQLLQPQPVEVPIKPLLIKNRWLLVHLPENVVKVINEKWGLQLTPEVVYDRTPQRYEQYAKMPGNTAQPSILVDGQIYWGVGRFVAALMRGDKTIRVWNVSATGLKIAATKVKRLPPMPDDVKTVAESVRAKYEVGRTKGKCLDAASEIINGLGGVGSKYNPSVQFGAFKGKTHMWNELIVDGQRVRLDVTVDQFGDYPTILWELPDRKEYKYEY